LSQRPREPVLSGLALTLPHPWPPATLPISFSPRERPGVPKGVMISAAAARHYAQMISRLLDLRASDRALETCELTFDFSVHNMFSTWEAGAALHILPATVVMNAVKFVRNAQLTVWNSVPSLVGMLRQLKTLHPDSLEDLRVTVFGGEALPEEYASRRGELRRRIRRSSTSMVRPRPPFSAWDRRLRTTRRSPPDATSSPSVLLCRATQR
jgi:non-ribosomal peptide synthetase component F